MPPFEDDSYSSPLEYQVLRQQYAQDLASNPWLQVGQAIRQQKTPFIGQVGDSGVGGFLGTFLPALVQGGVSGFAEGYGRGSVEQAYNDPESGYVGILGSALEPEANLDEIYQQNPAFAERFRPEVSLLRGQERERNLKQATDFVQKQQEDANKLATAYIQAGVPLPGRIARQLGITQKEASIVKEPNNSRGGVVDIFKGESKEGLSADALDIANRVPLNLQKEALKEKGVLQDLNKNKEVIGGAYDDFKDLSTIGSMIPLTTANAEAQARRAAVVSAIQAQWKGVMSDADTLRILPLLPSRFDSDERLEVKKRQMINLLEDQAKSTPVLREFTPKLYEKYLGIAGEKSAELPGGAESAREAAIRKRMEYYMKNPDLLK